MNVTREFARRALPARVVTDLARLDWWQEFKQTVAAERSAKPSLLYKTFLLLHHTSKMTQLPTQPLTIDRGEDLDPYKFYPAKFARQIAPNFTPGARVEPRYRLLAEARAQVRECAWFPAYARKLAAAPPRRRRPSPLCFAPPGDARAPSPRLPRSPLSPYATLFNG